jgi:hypothetical protein
MNKTRNRWLLVGAVTVLVGLIFTVAILTVRLSGARASASQTRQQPAGISQQLAS